MNLAKDHIDIGLFTNRRDEQLQFWSDVIGLPFDHLLKLGQGVHQHRFHVHGSIVKINHTRHPLLNLLPAGYRELLIVRQDRREPARLFDPDANAVTIVPAGHLGIVGIGIIIAVNSVAASRAFYGGILEMESVGADTYRCGDSRLFLKAAHQRVEPADMISLGYRYLTIQVADCDAEHERILCRGGMEGRAPVTLGTTARIAFVRDPDGNWIEISQRASLTGNSF